MTNLCLEEAGCPGLCCQKAIIEMPQKQFSSFTKGLLSPPVLVDSDQLNDPWAPVTYALISDGKRRIVNLHGPCPHYHDGCNIYPNRPDGCQRVDFNGSDCLKLRGKIPLR